MNTSIGPTDLGVLVLDVGYVSLGYRLICIKILHKYAVYDVIYDLHID